MSIVLALRVPDAIVLAADSRVSYTEDGITRRVNDDGCKILAYSGTAFAAAGSVLLDDAVDAFQVAKAVMTPGTPVGELADAFIGAISPALRRTMERAFVRPAHAGNEIVKGIQFLFANAVGRQPSLAWRNLGGTGNAGGIKGLSILQAFDWPGNGNTVIAAGDVPAIPSVPSFRTAAHAQNVAERLIAAAGEKRPDTVGGPVDVLVLGPKGLRWLRRKAEMKYGWSGV
jgi:hypothetical protein